MPAQTPDPEALICLFYDSVSSLGQFQRVGKVNAPYSALLDHNEHMTVAIERYHKSKVDVEVLDVLDVDEDYVRKILLRRQSDRAVVQFGIVRLKLAFLAPAVRELVRSQDKPLGRVLVEHDVMRQVELVQLLNVQPASPLRDYFACETQATTCGRTALIHVDDEPAVELLEIVAPVPIVQ